MNVSSKLSGTVVVSATAQLLFSLDDKTYVPLQEMAAIQTPTQQGNFIVRYFEEPIAFERGATLAHFLLALEPWKEVLTLYTDRDVGAYIDACRRPVAVFTPSPDDISTIVIAPTVSVSRHTLHHYDTTVDECTDLEEYFNAPRRSEPTALVECEHMVNTSGFCASDPLTPYSLMTDFDKIKNLPIVLEKEGTLWSYDRATPLLNPNALGAQMDGDATVHFKTADVRTTVREAVFSVLVNGLFFATPKGMKRFTEKLKNDPTEEKLDAPPPLMVVGENQPTIQIKDGAFDGVIEALNHESAVWSAVVKSCATARIGTIHL